MVKKSNQSFYGKIILFGEYGIIFDSMALTIPFTHFHGELSFNNRYNKFKYTDYDFANSSNLQLENYSAFLKKLIDEKKLPIEFNFNRFVKDLDNGLYFESSIPQGYGLGSSGALVAALYDEYVTNKIEGGRSVTREENLKLKEIFATMESFFHGKSSGIDPLNSYVQFPLHIKSKTDIETVGIPRNRANGDSGIFLINSGNPSKTEPLVNQFLKRCDDPNYFHVITNDYIPLNDACITNLIEGNTDTFFENVSDLSALQFEYFKPMIPDSLLSAWENGIQSDLYKIKLCGSGGGGYLLGFTRDLGKAREYFNQKGIDFVTVYKSVK